MSTKHIARYGKVWQDKRNGKLHGRELELPDKDSITNYTMVSEPKKEAAVMTPKKKGMFENE